MSWHLTPVYVAEDVIADVWKFDDWGGDVETRFYKGGKAVDVDPIILPGEWLIALAKEMYQGETVNWLMSFVESFIKKQEIQIKVSANWTRTLYYNSQIVEETVKTQKHTVKLSHPADWEGTLQMEYYDYDVSKEIPIESYEVPCAWILGVARFGYWVLLQNAFASASDTAEDNTPEKDIYAWDEWKKRKKQ